MTSLSCYLKKAARPSQSPAVTALPEGEPRVDGLHVIFCHSEPVTDVTGVGIRPPRLQARKRPRRY